MKNNRKFCFMCGKKTQKLIDGYCEECFRKKQLVILPKKISIAVCSKCGLVKIGNKWGRDFKKIIENNIKTFGEIKEMEVTKEDNKIHVRCRGYIQGLEKKEEQKIELKEKKVLCSICARKSGGYYEAILQFRGETENLLNFAIELLEKQKNVFYRIERIKEGINLYLSSKQSAEKIAKLLKNRFKVKIKKSYKLVGRKQGRNIYRNIILLRV